MPRKLSKIPAICKLVVPSALKTWLIRPTVAPSKPEPGVTQRNETNPLVDSPRRRVDIRRVLHTEVGLAFFRRSAGKARRFTRRD